NLDPGFTLLAATDTWQSDSMEGLNYIGDNSHYSASASAAAAWSATGLDRKNKYDVYAHIPHDGNPDTPSDQKTAKYTVSGTKTITLQIHQPRYPGWTLLAANFEPDDGGGITVKIEAVAGSETGLYIDADAIKIVSAGTADPGDVPANAVRIVFAHYYVRNANGTFLVNMDGDPTYYRFDDDNGNDMVEVGELVGITLEDATQAGITTGRTYAQERQNFANWYQFYRKRAFTGIGAVGQFIDDLSGVYFRLYGFPPAGFKFKLEPIRVTVDGNYYDETETVLRNLYELKSPQAVSNQSLRTALYDTGDLMETGKSNGAGKASDMDPYSSDATYPFFSEAYGGHCQQSFAVLMTGGYWNLQSENIYVGDVDGDDRSNTLADVAMYFYHRDLRANLADKVAANYMDDADWQHLVVYGVSFGAEGTLDPSDYPNCHLGGDCPVWPQPQGNDPTTIDDLWHATVNGRGLFVNAANPEELVRALKSIRSDIEIRLGSAAAVSTNSVQRQIGTYLYQGTYHSGFWAGDLLAKPLDVDTGAVGDAAWSAQEMLEKKNPNDRKIFTFDGSDGKAFLYSSLTDVQKNQLDPNDPLKGAAMVEYLRGNRNQELKAGGSFRNRDGKLGDIVHSEPVYHDGVVYVGANDGMLHAFDAGDGEELFAYVPNLVFGHLAELTRPTYEHRYYVNSTPYAQRIDNGQSLLVGGLGKGGKGYFGLDITAPESFGTEDVLWEYDAAIENDPDLGYSFSRPFIVKTQAAGWVVVFGNGYNSVNGEAVLYVLKASDGSLVKKIHTGVLGCNGIVADAAIIDPNFDGYADYVYVGDLKGNLWKFDISGASTADWGSAFVSGAEPQPLFTAKNAQGQAQPITAAADIMRHCKSELGYLVIFGTGQYAGEADFDTTDTQSLYGVTDRQPSMEEEDPELQYLGEFTTDRRLSNVPDRTLLQQSGYFITHGDKDYFVMSSHVIDYAGSHLGWYFDLPKFGERMIRDPIIRSKAAVFIGSTPDRTPCSSGGSSVLYQIDACSGGAASKPQFDIDASGSVDGSDVITINGVDVHPSGLVFDGAMLYRPVSITDRLYVSDDSANINEVVVPGERGGMLYWRETDIRR
ncbi:MAG: PilC/PilY family type IV pilus protein, partial [Desulfosarcina sp.]